MATLRRTSDALTLVVLLVGPQLATAATAWLVPLSLPPCEADLVQRSLSPAAWVLGGMVLWVANVAVSYAALAADGGRGRRLVVMALGLLATTGGFAVLLHATAHEPSSC